MARGIFVPQPGIELTLPCIARQSLHPWTTGEVHPTHFCCLRKNEKENVLAGNVPVQYVKNTRVNKLIPRNVSLKGDGLGSKIPWALPWALVRSQQTWFAVM